jgi:NAD(P)-dependent dehydrogenase (short-subunit alcohol dehydrogenase family)
MATESDRALASRREFLGRTTLAMAAGTAGVVGLSASAVAQAEGKGDAKSSPQKPANAASRHQTPLADVKGKVAFITGGSSGIGLGMARAFSAAGMKVVFTYRREDHRDEALKLLGTDNAGVLAIKLDVTDRAGFARAADEAEKTFGKVHLLANNAGIGVMAGAAEATFKDWDWGLGVNLGGVVNGIATLLPRMRAHGEGAHVIVTSSSAGLVAGGKIGIYVTSKFAVVGLMESLREELEGENVGVSIFCPGLVQSNIIEAEKMRPPELVNEVAKPSTSAPSPEVEAAMRKFMAVAMDALTAGQQVLTGIRRNDLYIFTHQEFEQPTRERMEALLASFPVEKAPNARSTVAKRFMTDLYARERDRRLAQRKV